MRLRATGLAVHRMASGAGHDAMIVARRMPAAMLFLRSPGGISHHPDETVLAEDVAAALARGCVSRKDWSCIMRVDRGELARRCGAISQSKTAGSRQLDPICPARREEIDARGLLVFPGLIDVHVHFNEPGRTEWEGAATGSRALAAGGGTLFFDMPLNSTPCTVNAATFDRKRAALEGIVDHRLRSLGRPGARQRRRDGGARRARRRRIQSVPVRFRSCPSFRAPTI